MRQWSTPAGRVCLGHRRLEIQDPRPRSNQPLCDGAGRYWISFNGEVLNFPELRHELVTQGVEFRTDSDTEVLLELLHRHGPSALERVRGFFAFVMLDLERNELIAARDRYGIKPLYYTTGCSSSQPWLAFASEIKQFGATPGHSARLDPSALRDYLTWGWFDHTDGTFFSDIQQVAPGHAAIVDLRGTLPARPRIHRWAAAQTITAPAVDQTAADTLGAALDEVVALNLRADVELSVALSGGLDSSSVCARAAKQLKGGGRELMAFGVMFPDDGFSEQPYAEAVAARSGVELFTTALSPDCLRERFETVLWHFDEPVVRPSMLAQHALYELIAQHGRKVVLTGQGGDELLCGYPAMYGAALIETCATEGIASAASELSQVLKGGTSWRVLREGLLGSIAPRWMLDAAARGFGPRSRPLHRLAANSMDALTARAALCSEQNSIPLGSLLTRISHALARAGNLRMLLHYDDRNSMAFGIESRPVMVDPQFERVCLNLPGALKLRDGQSKWLLRRAMSHSLPASVLQRRDKLGFPVPDRIWQAGTFYRWLCEMALLALDEVATLVDDILDVSYTRRALQRGDSRGIPLWALASLRVWSRRFAVQLR